VRTARRNRGQDYNPHKKKKRPKKNQECKLKRNSTMQGKRIENRESEKKQGMKKKERCRSIKGRKKNFRSSGRRGGSEGVEEEGKWGAFRTLLCSERMRRT